MKAMIAAAVLLVAVFTTGCGDSPLTSPGGQVPLINDPGLDPSWKLLNVKEDAWGWVYNPCTGEVVELLGTAHVMELGTVTINGVVNYKFSVTFHLKGTGVDSGIGYIYHGSEPITSHLARGFVYKETLGDRLISQGGYDNLYLRLQYKLVITPKGEVVVDRLMGDIDCVG